MQADTPEFDEFELQDLLIEHLEVFQDDAGEDEDQVGEIRRLDERRAGFTVVVNGKKFEVRIKKV